MVVVLSGHSLAVSSVCLLLGGGKAGSIERLVQYMIGGRSRLHGEILVL